MTTHVKQPSESVKRGRAWAALPKPVRLARLSLLALFSLVGLCLGSGCFTECNGPDCASCSGADCGAAAGASAGAAPSSGRFSACLASADCDEAHGFACVKGECSYACRSHEDCREVGHCDFQEIEGTSQAYCVRDDPAPVPGTFYTHCPSGNECAAGYLCIGAGEGDLDAYCTTDCENDASCSDGFYCGSIRRPPCEDACGLRGQRRDENCVPTEQIGADKPYQCGEFSVERSVCLQRTFCSPCTTNADCLAVPNQVCAKDESGEKICTQLCDARADSCPWGNAARCAVFDKELGLPTCSHRFGACSGTGQTCEPCRTNQDCEGGVCTSSSFTGERWCVNFGTQCECPRAPDATGACSDGGCADSPGGLKVLCINDPESGLVNTCYAANSSEGSRLGESPQTGCWAAQ